MILDISKHKVDICRFSFLNQKHNMRWFLPKKLVDRLRAFSLHIVSRNYSTTFYLINLQKTKTCPNKVLQQGLFVATSHVTLDRFLSTT